jgi:hypothetical protein
MAAPSKATVAAPRSKLADDLVEVMRRYQALGGDLERLRDHLRMPEPRGDVGVRVLAAMLTCATLEEWLTRMQITALSEKHP